jgi:hypothetical protein
MGTALAAAKHKPQVAYFHFCGEALSFAFPPPSSMPPVRTAKICSNPCEQPLRA